MEWESITEFGEEILYSGNYKIRYYHYIGNHPVTPDTEGAKRGYHAYFKPAGWKCWGNNIREDLKFYSSVDDAKTGCERHFSKFGNKPNEYQRISEWRS